MQRRSTKRHSHPTGKSRIFCPVPFTKIFLSPRRANHLYKFAPSRSHKRGVGHRHERWDGMQWTQHRVRRTRRCGRRSRVVLTPRRWRQVLEEKPCFQGATVTRKPGHRGERGRKPLKPLRREGRTASAEPVCSCAFCFAYCTRDRGCSAHPVFPAPSDFRAKFPAQLGRTAPRDREAAFATRVSRI